MNVKAKATVLGVAVLIALAFLSRGKIPRAFEEFRGISSDLKAKIENVEKKISTPPPLRVTREAPRSFLTVSGTIEETNRVRQENGLPPLSQNSALDASAAAKINDMFARQYFAHTSPSGVGAGDLAERAGYQYLAIGENLALGNFGDTKDLVSAWMESPGHRANILNRHYAEIGVYAARGTFEGKFTWLAVQHFGRPISDCPAVSEILKAQIQTHEEKLDRKEAELATRKAEIDAMTSKRGPEYRESVDEYNALVLEYNRILAMTKTLIEGYNGEVRRFNACIAT